MSADVIFMDKAEAQRQADHRLIFVDNSAVQFGGTGTLYRTPERKNVSKNLQGLGANIENLLWLTERSPAPIGAIQAMARTMRRDLRPRM